VAEPSDGIRSSLICSYTPFFLFARKILKTQQYLFCSVTPVKITELPDTAVKEERVITVGHSSKISLSVIIILHCSKVTQCVTTKIITKCILHIKSFFCQICPWLQIVIIKGLCLCYLSPAATRQTPQIQTRSDRINGPLILHRHSIISYDVIQGRRVTIVIEPDLWIP